jgi:hypothetical protein
MMVSAPGYQRFEAEIMIAADTKDLANLELPLHRGRTLSGRVYDEATGTPIPNANVSVRDSQDARFAQSWRSRSAAKSRADGTFSLEGVPAGSMIVEASAQGFAPRELSMTVTSDADMPLDIALSAGALIAGRLVAADGVTPVNGVVDLISLDQQESTSKSSEGDGRFKFENLAPGRYRLAAHAREGATEQRLTLATNEKLEDMLLSLRSGGTVRGVVTGLSRADLQRTQISISAAERVSISLGATPDERGGYLITGAPEGQVHVQALVANRRLLRRLIEVPADGDVTVDFAFPRTVRLSGRVTRAGQPVAGATLGPRSLDATQAMIGTTRTSATGDYVVEDLSEGDYQIIVAGHQTATFRVAGDTVFNIDIPQRATFAGEVTDEETGAPILRAHVMVSTATPSPADPSRGRTGETNQFGSFMVGRFDAGDYLVTVYKPGYSMIRERVTIGTARVQKVYKLRAEQGVDLLIRVPGAITTPQATLHALTAGRASMSIVLPVDADGRSSIPAALAGSDFSIGLPGYAPKVIERWNGQPLEVQLTAEKTASE